MSALGSLEARYADDHVPLALVLGALGTLAAVRVLLPDGAKAGPAGDAGGPPPEPFVALLLGVIATHDRLLELCGPAVARSHRGGETAIDAPARLPESLLR
jgi:hypothetical protein